jgi:transposase
LHNICSEFNISKATLSNWVKQFKTNSSNVFSDNLINNKATKIKEKQAEKEIENLYKKIGQLTVERDFLKKVLDT